VRGVRERQMDDSAMPGVVAPQESSLPMSPRLHWIWVFVLSLITVGLFWSIWMVVQAAWARRMNGKGFALWCALFYMVVTFAALVISVRSEFVPSGTVFASAILDESRLLRILAYLAAVSSLRSALQARPVGLWLSGLGSYFFGPIYFQYCLQNNDASKKASPRG